MLYYLWDLDLKGFCLDLIDAVGDDYWARRQVLKKLEKTFWQIVDAASLLTETPCDSKTTQGNIEIRKAYRSMGVEFSPTLSLSRYTYSELLIIVS